MKYFSKNKKWMAYLILLTFLFTSIMPSNLGSWDSAAYAEYKVDYNNNAIDNNGIVTLATERATNNSGNRTLKVVVQTEAGAEIGSKTLKFANNPGVTKIITKQRYMVAAVSVTGNGSYGDNNNYNNSGRVNELKIDSGKTLTMTIKVKNGPTPVPVVNTAEHGITITMKNIPGDDQETRPFKNGYFTDGDVWPNLVKRTLDENGYPELVESRDSGNNPVTGTKYTTDPSLEDCFAGGQSVTGLFLQSHYDSDKEFYYSSFEKSAILENGVLKVYNELMTPRRVSAYDGDKNLYLRGNFMPYNSLSELADVTSVQYNESDEKITGGRPLHVIPAQDADFHLGMTVSARFTQPEGGQLLKQSNAAEKENMIFEFNGDDDLWVFIDNVLILDIGGIHHARAGFINFATGDITVQGCDPTTIAKQFEEAYKNDSAKLAEAKKYLDGDTFKDFTEHEIKIFYMERGEGASDLKMKFNLPTIPANPEVKKIVEVNEAFVNDRAYDFDIKVKDKVGSEALYSGEVTILNPDGTLKNEEADNSNEGVSAATPGRISLKHNERALLYVPEGHSVLVTEVKTKADEFTTAYQVDRTSPAPYAPGEREIGVTSGWHEIKSNTATGVKVFDQLLYQFFNTVEKANLTITKELENVSAPTDENGQAVPFKFQVYFKNSIPEAKKDTSLVKRMPEWTLYTGDWTLSKPDPTDPTKIVSEDKKASGGNIYLNAGETAVLKDIPEGTEYFITEVLDDDVYDGYTVKEELTTAVAGESGDVVASGDLTVGTEGISGSIIIDDSNNDEKNDDINVVITNTKLGDIEFTKTDGTNQPLAGAKFSLYSDAECTNEDEVEEYTGIASNADGIVTFADVPYGTYYLKEIDFDGVNDNQVTIGGKTYAVNPTVYTAVVGASVTISDAAGNLIADNGVNKVVNNEVMTEISGVKSWVNVPDTVTKPSVKIGLYDGTTRVREVTLDGTTDDNGEYEAWKYKFTVPKYKNGAEITYTVEEISIGGVAVTNNTTKTANNAATGYYNVTVNGKDITNSYVKDVTATKTWIDGNPTSRPKIEVKLYNGATEVTDITPSTVTDGNVTTYTWAGVPANGTYTVKEFSVGGEAVPYTEASPNAAVVEVDNQKYKVENNGLTITNTLLTDISGTKIWKNANNSWPTGANVIVGLYVGNNAVKVNDVAVTDTLTGATDNRYSFADLPKYNSNGTQINYTVKELGANGAPTDTVIVDGDTYQVSYVGNNIINTLTGDADITVTKTWVDDNNRDGLRKAITVVLQQKVGSGDWADVASLPNYNNAAQPVTKEIALSDNMSHTWYNVPLYTNEGAEILYRVVENDVTGYVPSYSADSIGAKAANRTIEITNTHVPETVTIKVEKAWAGEAGYTALRGESLNFDVIGKVGTETVVDRDVTVSASDSWAAKTLTVPKYHNGNVITYTVTETAVPEGYEVSYKVNGSAGNTWSPQTQATLIERIVAFFTGEDTSAEDTTPAIDCTVTATNTLQTAGIKLTKAYSGGIFNGKTDVAGGATFTLTGNNSETITLTRDGAVYATTSAALKYGVVYTLQEGAPAGYTGAADQYLKLVKVEGAYKVVACDENGVVLTGNNAAAYSLSNNDIADLGTITNYVVKGSFVFTKAFNSAATDPTFIVYEAVKNGDAYTRGNKVTDIVSNEGMVYTISNLECGKSYEIVETAPGYEPVTFYLDVAEGTGDKANTAVVTLTKTLVAQVAKDSVWTINDGAYTLTNQAQKTNLVLTKTYDEKQENKIGSGTAIFEVYTDAKYENKIASVTFNADSNNYIFTDLEYGKTYYVKEIAPAGFVPVAFTIDVDVTANGAVVAAIEGYNANRDGSYTVNNEIKTTSLTFDKVYVGPQPDTKATFNVTNNKDDVKDTLKANAEGNYTMANLKYGYTYSVVENAPEGYVPVAFTVAVGTDGKLTVSQTKANGYETIDAIETADGVVTVKNYLKQDKVDLFGTKSWIGGTTDSAIEIKLFRDGAEQATTTTSVDFNWKYIFAGLDRFNLETGKAYEYTVVETPLDGFTAHYDETVTADGIQIDITNVKDEEMVAISGQKVWHDVAGTKHEPIEIALYRSTGTEDGKELVEKVTLSDEKGWTYNFGLLPKADPDSHIYYKYEVVELNVPAGYVSVVNGYDVHNIATPLYELGDISVTKKVVGTPANPNAVYDFVLYVKATVKGTLDSAQQKLQAVLVDDYLRLRDKELPAAEGAKEAAKAAFESSVFLTATSASAYTFFLTDESDNAVMGLTTGSAYYVDHVNMPLKKTEAAPAKLIGALITAIEELAEEFLNAIAEDPAAAKPTQSVMLSRIAQNSSVMKEAAAVNAVTTSAIAFKADNMQGLFDSVVTHKTTLQEYQDAKAAWEAFDTSVTTPTAIVLVVNGDFDNPIELDPEKGRQSEENENILEFTVENGEYTETVRFNTATGQYEIPFSLLKDETIKFNMKAATGSAIEYYITEDKPVDDNYDHTDIKAYLYNGSLKDLENTMKAEEYLNTLTSTTSKLTSGSAANYEFYNHYKEKESGGGGYTPPYIPPEDPVDPPKPPEEIIEDPEVPLDEPPVVVPGEEIPEMEVPLGDAPRTGDTNNAVPFMALMLFAMAGLAVTRRRFN